MKLTPPSTIVPGVEEVERLVFRVRSRSGKDPRTVDLEMDEGRGICDCPQHRYKKNLNCWHLTQVRKFISVKVAQEVIMANNKR